MGGSGGGFFSGTTPEQLRESIRAEEEKTANQEFDNRVSVALNELLRDANSRDAGATRDALEEIVSCLEEDIEGSLETVLGGSVKKHTYVDGISDVDALVILKDPSLAAKSPKEVLDYFEQRLRQELPEWEVAPHGPLAVTLRREDFELQLLPAIRRGTELAIPSEIGIEWSRINPRKFYEALSRANQRQGGQLIPTVKLAKVINDTLPKSSRLSGYHVESLAIEAFREYAGPANTKAMLKHFFDKARGLVLAPIRDKTGQSVHVDEYLGSANSDARKVASATLDRVYRQMRNADGLASLDQWLRLFGER